MTQLTVLPPARIHALLLALFLLAAPGLAIAPSDYHAGSLPKQEPQPIYSADLHDPWNRIFYLLFTRTVDLRLTADFSDQGPFVTTRVMGNPSLQVTSRTFQRIESGDHAIDPLYPNFFSTTGSEALLTDPQFTDFKQALKDACAEAPRPPLHRALMQADAWAAFDILSWSRQTSGPLGDHARQLLPLLGQFIARLALSSQEIAALPSNYAVAQRRFDLPPVFDERSGWIEVGRSSPRSHDAMLSFRRAARVFLKPPARPQDFLAEVNRRARKRQDPLPGQIGSLDGTALLTQILLVDREGRVVPSPLVSDVQLRTPVKDAHGQFQTTAVMQYELSRKLLLADPASGGLVRIQADDPAYLPASGNDFTFASRMIIDNPPSPPILGTLKRRCETCHFETTVFTFSIIPIPHRPPIQFQSLNPRDNAQANLVAAEAMKRDSFKLLQSFREPAPASTPAH